MFATYRRDAETTGLDYADQRYYQPGGGRFLTADPGPTLRDNPTSWNRYAYAWGDPVNLVDPDGMLPITHESLRVIRQPVWNEDKEDFEYQVVYVCPARIREGGRSFRFQLWEEYVQESGVSETCAKALVTSGNTPDNAEVANENRTLLQSAANAHGIDWRLLAAVGVRESGFLNINERGGGNGAGIFQIDLGRNPSVRRD
jgi:RHS repeat-associated protein